MAGAEINLAHALRGTEVRQELRDEFRMGGDGEYLRQTQGETVESLTAKLEKGRAASLFRHSDRVLQHRAM